MIDEPSVSTPFPRVSLLIPGGTDAARRAGHAVLAQVGERVDAGVATDLGVAISELVSNSVIHAEVDSGRYLRVTVGALGDRLLLAVSDHGSPAVPRLTANGDDNPRGLGLRLVDRLARSWGVARDGTGRTRVWCELALPAEDARAES